VKKSYDSVSEMTRDICDDPAFADEFDKIVAKKRNSSIEVRCAGKFMDKPYEIDTVESYWSHPLFWTDSFDASPISPNSMLVQSDAIGSSFAGKWFHGDPK